MVVGRCWSFPGGFGRPEDRRLGASEGRKEENRTFQQKPAENQKNVLLGAFLGVLLEASLGPSWRPFGPS
eukprot:243680-Pyramimonas_sp.AAC.1